jgi:hypothetical protein
VCGSYSRTATGRDSESRANAREMQTPRSAWRKEGAFRQREGESGATSSGCVVVMALSIYDPGTQEENSLKKIGDCRHERSESIMEVKEWLGSEQACRTP